MARYTAFLFALAACTPSVEVGSGPGGGGTDTEDGGSTTASGSDSTTAATSSSDSATQSTTEGTTDAGPCVADGDCDDGMFCNGSETCSPDAPETDARGCVAGTAPCQASDVCSEAGEACLPPCEVDGDNDDDGVDSIECGGTDCDDTNPAIFPGAAEVCDDVDDDCDPSTIEGGDGDGDDDGIISATCCNADDAGDAVCGTDCNDSEEGGALGNWFECEACGTACGVREACENQACTAARRVFITSSRYEGDLGGEGGADALCAEVAEDAGLGGSWRAYLLQTPNGLARHAAADVPYIRLDGVRIADSWADLGDGSIAARLNVTENLDQVGGNAWTGLSDQNMPGSVDCQNWSTTEHGCLEGGPCGGAGESNMTDTHWDGYYVFHCDAEHRLYCIEQ